MGIFNIFSSKENEKQLNTDDEINLLSHYKQNIIEEEIKNKLLCLKIYIIGTGDRKEYIINNVFKDKIVDENLRDIADKELKTEQFHWIVRIYNDELLTSEKCKTLREEIKKDKAKKNQLLKYQVIICFGKENIKILSSHFVKLRRSRMIFITNDSEYDLDEKMDKRYATNIICNNITNEQLNSKIISALWELDCCFNEKGNQICRYTPEKIFNGLEKDNSLFSINILLTGLSRSGKSTFINLLSGKIMALEGDATESVTKIISEYYIYKDDDKDEHGAIKIIDTPGIVPNKNDKDNEYKNVEDKVLNMIKEQDKNFENQIHFIFFVLNRGNSLEGENIGAVLKALNESKCPVYFIINRVRENTELEDVIDPITEFLDDNKYQNLMDEDKFILVNFKEDEKEAGKIHGIDEIFKKIYGHIKGKKYLDEELGNKMKNLLKDFRAIVEPHKSFISYERNHKELIDNLKLKIDFFNRMEEIDDLTSENYLFSKIELMSIVDNGQIIAKKCKDVIISLSNLKDVLPSGEVPILSIFQAFMVKEIGEGYGLDINILNIGTKLLINHMKNIVSSIKKEDIENKNDKDFKILDVNEIVDSLDIIKDKVKNKLDRKDRDSILDLAKTLNQIKTINEKGKNKNDLQIFNQNFTNEVYSCCKYFFEKELIESEGLTFMVNYFNKCELLLKDIEYYIDKKDWGQYNIEIKK